MSAALELKKIKRTGFAPAFIGAGLLTAAIPICNIALREETFIRQNGPALRILMGANWQMMAMVNLFMVVIGACILYYNEFADQAMQKMESLPIRQGVIFFNKCLILAAALAGMLAMETITLAFCAQYWFDVSYTFAEELLKSIGYAAISSLPALLLMTAVSSACRTMWVPLGIGVIGVFVTVIIAKLDSLACFYPFSLPFQTLCTLEHNEIVSSLWILCAESVFIGGAELVYLRVRRKFQ